MRKIFCWSGSSDQRRDGCHFWRIDTPYRALADARLIEWSTSQMMTTEHMSIDIIVGQRISKPGPARLWSDRNLPTGLNLNNFRGMRAYESDDLLLDIPEENPASEYYSEPEIIAAVERAISSSDRVIVSTEPLTNEYSKYNSEVYVAPNGFPNWHIYPPVDQRTKKPRLGWAGSATHHGDWAIIEPVLRSLNPRIDIYGHPYGEGELDHYRYFKWFAKPGDLWRSYQFHVGLAPLVQNRFNECKSNIKVLEYWSRGIVPVASSVYPYATTIRDGETGFLCRTPEEWRDRISLLLTDHSLRQKMAKAGRKELREHRTIYAVLPEWVTALSLESEL